MGSNKSKLLKNEVNMKSLIKYFAIIFFLMALVLFSNNAKAAVLNVDQADPACDDIAGTPFCSIQAAVDAAAASGDVIEIAAGTYLENVIANDTSLTLVGEDRETTIVDGGSVSGVFNFISLSAQDVDLNQLTIRNGNQATGGGVFLDTGTLTISDCEISNNEATVGGGGIFFNDGALVINNSDIIYNEAIASAAGGFYHATGDATITDTHIDHNEADTAAGLLNTNGLLTLTNSTVDHNTADNIGGIYSNGATATFTNSSVSNNTATSSIGGVYHVTGDAVLTDSSINANEADTIAGLYVASGNLTITGSSLNDNVANNIGAIYHATGTLAVSDSTINGNDAGIGQSAGIYHAMGETTLTDTEVDDNVAGLVAGIYQANGNMIIERCSVSGNEATLSHVGGIYQSAGTLDVVYSNINDNSAAGMVGAIYHTSGTLSLTSSLISNNSAEDNVGAVFTGDMFLATNTTFSGNTAYNSAGAVYSGGTTSFHNVTVANNVADYNNDGNGEGGGVHVFAGTFTAYNSIIAENTDRGHEANDCFGPVTSGGYNILGENTGCTYTTAAGDIVGSASDPVDPGLEALADNGGYTFTHALQADSLAVETANPTGCLAFGGSELTTDGRGNPRPADSDNDGTAVCDMGAYEFGSCGDGYVDEGEACDDGNGDDSDSCTNQCTAAVCGDGSVYTATEECDDGNLVDGDGCDSTCEIEEEPVEDVEEDVEDDADAVDSEASESADAEATSSGGCSLIADATFSQNTQGNPLVIILMSYIAFLVILRKRILSS